MTRGASLLDRYGTTALVTGAASGIGRSFAEQLAGEGFSLVLVDRNREGLEACRTSLGAAEGTTIELLAGDLTDRGFLSEVARRSAGEGVGLVVHSAGISSMGRFLDLPIDALHRELELHCRVSLELAHAAGNAMRTRGRGGIVLLSSNSALLRSPYVSNYAATKAYTLALAESLYEDLRHDGVDVLGLVPGMTRTTMLEDAKPSFDRAGRLVSTPEAIAQAALAALGRAPLVVPSTADRIAATLFTRVLPKKLGLVLARRSMEHIFAHLGRR